jgi:dihydrofolate reductase
MIRFIAATDEKRGLANDEGIPWQGKVPSDVRYYHEKLKRGLILLGYGTYVELSKPMDNRLNYVATTNNEALREGFEPVGDARVFLQQAKEDVWCLGGAGLFATTIDLADELYLTQLEGDYGCTKFFPEYEKDFELASKSEPITENGITYRFTVWKRLPKQG